MSTDEISLYRVYSLDEAAALLRLPAETLAAAIASGELAGRQAGGEHRILGQALVNYLMARADYDRAFHALSRFTDRVGLASDAWTPRAEPNPPRSDSAPRVPDNRYRISTARGGKDDWSVEEALAAEWEAIQRGETVRVTPSSLDRSHWNGTEEVELQDDSAVFSNRREHAMVPVAIKAAVRVLHRHGLRGRFAIGAWDAVLSVKPLRAASGNAPLPMPQQALP